MVDPFDHAWSILKADASRQLMQRGGSFQRRYEHGPRGTLSEIGTHITPHEFRLGTVHPSLHPDRVQAIESVTNPVRGRGPSVLPVGDGVSLHNTLDTYQDSGMGRLSDYQEEMAERDRMENTSRRALGEPVTYIPETDEFGNKTVATLRPHLPVGYGRQRYMPVGDDDYGIRHASKMSGYPMAHEPIPGKMVSVMRPDQKGTYRPVTEPIMGFRSTQPYAPNLGMPSNLQIPNIPSAEEGSVFNLM